MKTVTVFAPGTVANIGCGFDVMGLALDGAGDEMEVSLHDSRQQMEEYLNQYPEHRPALCCSGACNLAILNESSVALPAQAEKNVITPAVCEMAKAYFLQQAEKKEKEKLWISIKILKKILPGSGIGSSAASSAAAVFGLNELLGKPFTGEELVIYAMEGEKLISGTAHADNVGPAILGGVVFIRGYQPLDLIKLPVPSHFFCTVVHPHIMVSTKEARELLPAVLPRKDAIAQWGNVGGFIAGLVLEDLALLGRSVQDVVAEPYRKKFIPGYDSLKETLMKQGMLGVNISGSGPSVFALSDAAGQAEKAKEIMSAHFAAQNIPADIYVCQVGKCGCRLIKNS